MIATCYTCSRVNAGLLLLGSCLAVACEGAAPAPRGGPEPAPVSVGTVLRLDVPLTVRTIGTVEADSTVAIVAQVTGRIQRIHFEEGAMVEKGAPLFSIDTRPYNATLAAAEADLARSEALAQQAALEAERYRALTNEGLASSQEAAQREAEHKSLTAAVSAARARIAGASLDVQLATIRSPITGRTGRVLVHLGNVVRASDPSPLVVVRSLSPVKVAFSINEELLPLVRQRLANGELPVTATPRGELAQSASGRVNFIDNTVDPATGTVTLKAVFANQDQALWPGAFVDVVATLRVDEDVVAAPEAAIAEGQDGSYAFVVGDDAKARLHAVKVARRTESVAVIETGLAEGDQVVVDGLVRLRDGTPVSIKAAPATAALATTAAPTSAATSEETPSGAQPSNVEQ